MTVRAKFYVANIDAAPVYVYKEVDGQWGNVKEEGSIILLHPVASDGNPENKEFYAATPGGEIRLAILNAAAAKQFEPGKNYYVDFTKAE